MLATSGTYTIKYFSVDALGNTESVKTAATQIRIDTDAPTAAMTFPANASTYNAAGWSAGCSTANRLCGTAADTASGVENVRVSLQRSSDAAVLERSTWVTTATSLTPTGTASWSVPLATSALTNGVSYTATVVVTDAAGNVTTTPTVFGYDTTGPSATASSTTNRNGTVQAGDTVTITFGEALNPTTVAATGTLTLSRGGTGNTTWGVSGFTNGQVTTGTTGYLKQPSSNTTYTVTYAGTLALSGDGRTITFTVTGACSGSCTQVTPPRPPGRGPTRPRRPCVIRPATPPPEPAPRRRASCSDRDVPGHPTTGGRTTSPCSVASGTVAVVLSVLRVCGGSAPVGRRSATPRSRATPGPAPGVDIAFDLARGVPATGSQRRRDRRAGSRRAVVRAPGRDRRAGVRVGAARRTASRDAPLRFTGRFRVRSHAPDQTVGLATVENSAGEHHADLFVDRTTGRCRVDLFRTTPPCHHTAATTAPGTA